ncbi:carbohydrate binding domain-containing protein [Rhizoctonia solani AG-1 IA]|uniref:Carbohydrate binding domain-containing protein n=1 Tax=Thanatephorus cucumeris (strain AG1-IA) TaxID=983506 RepID=L8WTC8_THACA|nr:carbohydrate binding domain-containing protein [Rhizoctonia solani AG-1 IA]
MRLCAIRPVHASNPIKSEHYSRKVFTSSLSSKNSTQRYQLAKSLFIMHRIPKWQPDIAYTSGNVVCYQVYRQAPYGLQSGGTKMRFLEVQPGKPDDAWKQNFNDAWQRNIAYTAHSVVTYNGMESKPGSGWALRWSIVPEPVFSSGMNA